MTLEKHYRQAGESVSDCVAANMKLMANEPKYAHLDEKAKLGRAYGMCSETKKSYSILGQLQAMYADEVKGIDDYSQLIQDCMSDPAYRSLVRTLNSILAQEMQHKQKLALILGDETKADQTFTTQSSGAYNPVAISPRMMMRDRKKYKTEELDEEEDDTMNEHMNGDMDNFMAIGRKCLKCGKPIHKGTDGWSKMSESQIKEQLSKESFESLKEYSMYLKSSDKRLLRTKTKKDELISKIIQGYKELQRISRLGSY